MPVPLLNLKTHNLDFNNEAEARLIGVLLLPYLLEPRLSDTGKKPNKKDEQRLEQQRRRVRWIFLSRELSRFKKADKLKELDVTVRKSLKGELSRKTGTLAYAGKPKDYLPAIARDHKPKQSDPLRQIFTAGLMVLILEYMHAVEKVVPQMGLAFNRLYDTYQTNTLWVVNTDKTPKAWGRNMRASHLAAAWVRLLIEKKRLQNSRKAFLTLQRNLPTFLAYARHYENFLTVEKITGQTKYDHQDRDADEISRHPILKPELLWTVRDVAPDVQVAAIAALPTEGVREKSE